MNLHDIHHHRLLSYSCTLSDQSDCCGSKVTYYRFRDNQTQNERTEKICNKCRESCGLLGANNIPRNASLVTVEIPGDHPLDLVDRRGGRTL